MPTVGFFKLGAEFAPVKSLGRGGSGHRLVDSRLHATQTAHVHVGLGIFDHGEDLVGMLENPVLDVHPTTLGVLLLTADRLGVAEVLRVLSLVAVEILVVEKIGRFGQNAQSSLRRGFQPLRD